MARRATLVERERYLYVLTAERFHQHAEVPAETGVETIDCFSDFRKVVKQTIALPFSVRMSGRVIVVEEVLDSADLNYQSEFVLRVYDD